MIRELEEEVGIIATDLHISISQQSMNRDDGMTYFNTFFEINNYTEVVSNKETDKCSELIFLSLDALKDEKVAPYLCPPCTRVRQRWTDFLGNPVGDHTIIVYSFSLHPMNF